MSLLHRLKHDPRTAAAWDAIGRPVSAGLAAYFRAVHATSRITVVGAPADGPAVYVNWHRYLPYVSVEHGLHRRWILISPAPYMAAIVRTNEAMGVRVVRGASGQGGAEARDALIAILRRGESVFLAVDGPAGPPLVVKRGCVDIARAAGVPIIPVGYSSARGTFHPKRWDRMQRPALFDEITLRYGEPILVGDTPLDEALERVRAGLFAVCDSRADPCGTLA